MVLDKLVHVLALGAASHATRELLAELGRDGRVATKGVPAPIRNTARWVVERTDSWHTGGFRKLAICTEERVRAIEAFIGLANAILITCRLLREAWIRHRWDTRPTRRPRPIGGTS